jgi:hypothetical protein
LITKRKFLKLVSAITGTLYYSDAPAFVITNGEGGQWRPIAIGAGGYITGHSISNDGTTIVCRTDTYGCYVWNRRSLSWEQLRTSTRMPPQDVAPGNGFSEAGGYEIQVAPSDPNRIYMVTGFFRGPRLDSYVYISRDRGSSFQRTPGWTPTPLGSNGPSGKITNCHMAVDPANPDVVYVGTLTSGLFVTFDAGNTWNSVASVPASVHIGYSFSIAFDPTSGTTNGRTNKVYVCSDGNGFYQCTDGGGAFSAMVGGPKQVSDLAVSPVDGVCYACARGSGSANLWHCVAGEWNVLSNCNGHPAWSVAPDPANPNRIAVCDSGGRLNISIDHGATWPHAYNPPDSFATGGGRRTAIDVPWLAWTNEQYMSASMIRFDPSRTNVLTFSEGIGFWTTRPPNDTSEMWSWNSQNVGIEQLVANYVCSPPGNDPILAAWDRPIFRVENKRVYPSTHGPNNINAIQMAWSVDWASENPSTIVAVMNWFPSSNDQSGKSNDGGRSWTQFPAGSLPSSPVSGCIGGCIAAADADTYMWIPRGNGKNPNRSQPYITLDGGQSWTQTPPPDIPENGKTGWGDNYFLNRQIVCADRVLPRTFYAYNSGAGFYKYVAGATVGTGVWQKQNQHLVPHDEGLVKLRSVPGHAGHVLACSGFVTQANQHDCSFLRTHDGCKSFTKIAGVQCVYAFGFGKAAPHSDYPTVYFAGLLRNNWGIYRSTSSLAAWSVNTVEWSKIGYYPFGNYDSVNCVEGDANIYGTVYVGFGGSGWGYYTLEA